MAAFACGRAGDTVGPVRAMAGLAPARDRAVGPPGLLCMAGGTWRRRQAGVGIVTALAALMTRGSRRVLRRVAAFARRRRTRCVLEGGAVAGLAARMAQVLLRARDLRRMAGRAEHLPAPPPERVRLVTLFARDPARVRPGLGRSDRRVALRARRGHARGIVAMRRVARDARAPGAVLDPHVGVAVHARRGGVSRGMRRVAARAVGVRRHLRCECDFGSVTADARARAAGFEDVRPVAPDARRMPGRPRPRGLGVARRAERDGLGGRSMATVAIRASCRAGVRGVVGRPLFMARRAVGGDDRGRLVRAMALGAIGRSVRAYRSAIAVRAPVAARARGRRDIRSKRVAGEAVGRVCARTAAVMHRGFFRMASRAGRRAGILESLALEVMAVATGDVGVFDVLAVAGARTELVPALRDRAGHPGRLALPAEGERHHGGAGDREGEREAPQETPCRPRHRPTPWHSRQGKSRCSFLRLEKPGP